jgi:transposase-like protein
VLAYMSFHTDPLERLNREIKRRTNVASIFPNEAATVRRRNPARAERRVGRDAPLHEPGNHGRALQ